MEKYTNELIHSSSPYLKQHAHNPVNWVPWSDTIFETATAENKLVLVSVGYSACHWCHVMEHECFENEEVAALMNKHFINVKVDREERPDVDQVYMTAVQLMTQKGGWPLNCFTLPDGRPIYGGTYFPKEQWMHILRSLEHAQRNELPKLEDYAEQLHKGIVNSELIQQKEDANALNGSKLDELVQRWSKSFDFNEGGNSRAPKFPLPNNYEFLLDFILHKPNEQVTQHTYRTLDKMAMGGIYDQIGGGFARYSVDMLWKVPHFEKMLYDNGQLLSVYSEAYKRTKKPLYKRIVFQTIAWLEREMHDESGAFYAALDADSEGVEGKFYVWKESELKALLGADFAWVKEVYSINQRGYWEDENYILLRTHPDQELMRMFGATQDELEAKLQRVNEILLSERASRIRPGLDDKCLTAWNAIALKGLCDAYAAFGEEHFLNLAQKNAHWLLTQQLSEDGSLYRNYKEGVSTISGFLDDYAHTISAFTSLYSVTFNEEWLLKAKELLAYTLNAFYDEPSGMFFFTPSDTKLIARKMELSDNVIPASNSVMARNLFYLGKYFHDQHWVQQAKQMLANVYDGMEMYGSGYSNWAILLNHFVFGFKEIVVAGEGSEQAVNALREAALPITILAKAKKDSQIPLVQDKPDEGEALVYVCTEGTCFAPTSDVTEAVKQVIQL